MAEKLAAVLDSLDSTPEALHSFYVKNDEGKFILYADIENHPQTQGLRNAYRSDHEKVKTLASDLKKYEGVDPDRWAVLKDITPEDLEVIEAAKVSKRPASNTPNLDIDAEISKRVDPMKAAHRRELEQREALIKQMEAEKERLQQDMRQQKIETALYNACAEQGVLRGAMDEVVLYARNYFRINDEGEVVAINRDGTEMFGTDSKPMRPGEWIATREGKSHWFPLNSGGGAGGGRHNDGHISKKSDLKDMKAKVEYVRKHGQDKFLSLPD